MTNTNNTAPVASAPADERAAILRDLIQHASEVCDHTQKSFNAGISRLSNRARAALASAPVAGEAIPVAWLHQCRKKPELAQLTMKKHEPALAAKGYRPIPLYAAPQASEAVRNAALEEAAAEAYLALFPKNPRNDWDDYARGAATKADYVVHAICSLKSQPQADKDGGA